MRTDNLKLERELHGGIQKIYEFPNGYGASVVRHPYSYGSDQNLWELAVIKFDDQRHWELTYSTPVTDDVIGDLYEGEVDKYLKRIEKLPKEVE